jgi:Bacterial membrane protein YfhO
LVVVAVVVWGLVSLRSLTLRVTYLDDSSMHEQMVRLATAQWRAGHLPLTTWFPFLGEGSPQFLHYQSLPAMIAGAVGLITGPDVAFRWSLYLLLACWPISVYWSARLFGAGRGPAAASAAMAPFLVSNPGVGYEHAAYVWSGFGVWTQLWAMWTLPLAWGMSWRAIRDGRGYLRAVFCTALTMALHFETGYLALSVLIVWPFVAGKPLITRARRAVILLVGSLLASAWVVVPLLSQRKWASVNQVLQGTTEVNGYGAHQVLVWLFDGQMLDHGRFPVITVFAAVGFGLAWMTWTRNHDGRALLFALGLSLLFAFGRTTFGSVIDIVPGSKDLFFRRFMMGVQLSCLLLAGRGAGWLASWCVGVWEARVSHWPSWLSPILVFAVAFGVLAPAWIELDRYDRQDSLAITDQRAADSTQGAQLNRLIAVIKLRGGGRTYAGMPSNWGDSFLVGHVQVFKYLESRDVDVVGYTLRTASLLTNPEYYFRELDPSDYRLFAVRYLIIPADEAPPVHATLVMNAGHYALWMIDTNGYIQTGEIVGQLAANRTDVGTDSIPLLKSDLAAKGAYLRVKWGSSAQNGQPPTLATPISTGTISGQQTDLINGRARATVHMTHSGVAVLSASYDPGWRATVNGHTVTTEMIAPALVGVDVPAGTDHIVFQYHGYSDYPPLLALAALTLIGLGAVPVWLGRRQRRQA